MTRWSTLVASFLCLCGLPCNASDTSEDDSADLEVQEEAITDFDRDHWSFMPLVKPQVPKLSQRPGVNPIDLFLRKEIEAAGLEPLPSASRYTILRRVKFDLVGLPPTIPEIETASSLPVEDIVDRYLASPRYGERWAQHWLDLARFAETDGFEHDKVRADAWRYRDWVVRAFNEDMPYDRFVQLQIAGDELEPDNPDAEVATAFCLSGPDMPDINSQDERRHNLLNEITGTVGSVLLGLQLGCAQCHDHKYDPISQADFYRLRALFDPAVQVHRNKSIFTLGNSKEAKATFVMLRGDHRRPGPPIKPGFVRIADPWSTTLQGLDQQAGGRRTELAKWLTRPDHPLTPRVIVNRVWQQHFGRGLSNSSSDFGVMGEEPTHLDLLNWLATEFVEQGWSLKWLHRQILTSETYQRASHANEYGWTPTIQKRAQTRLHSATTADAENQLLTRFPRRRLEGEVVRDTLLSVSGLLNLEMAGPGVRPALPQEMVSTLLRNQWNVTKRTNQHMRRSIYVFARRNLRFPIFDAFDRPDANASCSCRNESTTATQSLMMLNSETSLSCAERLAQLCLAEAKGDLDVAAELALMTCYGRPVDEVSRRTARKFLSDSDATLAEFCLAIFNTNEFLYLD